jgi:thiol:disulfide interchange protein DsbA
MMLRRLLAPALFFFALSACAQPTAPAAAKPAAAKAAAAAHAAAKPAAPAAGYPVGPPPTSPPTAGFVPKAGLDYIVLPTPQPTYGQGKIEVAEVFSYRCIHCAEFQPKVNAWKKTMPADVRWEYVPAVFGGSWDDFARAYFAADLLGVQKRTHDAVFKGVFVDQMLKTGSPEEIADMYAHWGVDKAKFLATMSSFGVTAKLNRARQFALRTGISGTPTIIVDGKYRVEVTTQHGFEGMLATTSWLIAQERAAGKK